MFEKFICVRQTDNCRLRQGQKKKGFIAETKFDHVQTLDERRVPSRRHGVPCRRTKLELVGGDDELGVGVAAHAVDGAGSASANRIGVAAGMFGDHGDGTVSAAHDGALVIEGIGAPEIDDKTGVSRATHKGNRRADFNTEGFVGLSVGKVRGSGSVRPLVALDVDGAGRRGRAASVACGANANGIGGRANVAFDFLLGVTPADEVGQEKWQNEQTTKSCEIAMNLH
jgi:hypothetical protein